jgi:CspA family cold shock protein
MAKGTVKWFDQRKRYGFIEQDGGGDVFFHLSSVVGDKSLYDGDKVSFQIEQGEKGPKAVNVRKLRE